MVVQGSFPSAHADSVMLRPALALLVALVAPALAAQSLPAAAQAYLGDWVSYSDDGDEAQSVIRLTASGGVVTGRIVRLLPTADYPAPQFRCDDCHGRYQGVDLRTLPIVEGMEWGGDEFAGGRLLDPMKGRAYRGVLRLDGPDRLRVRGFLGIRAIGRTQIWRRAR